MELFMRYETEDNRPAYTREAFIEEFNKSLGAINSTGNFRPNNSVYYNDLIGDDWVII